MVPDPRRAAFIDRDGVINEDLGHVGRLEQFHLLPGAAEGLRRLAAHGFLLVVVTNQAGIAKGMYTEDDYRRVTSHMEALLLTLQVRLAGVYFCPHHPDGTVSRYAVNCDCRKPAPGLLRQAAMELDLDIAKSVLVGDKISDTQAGRAAGVAKTVLVRSGHVLPPDASRYADYCCNDLLAAALWICSQD